MGSEEATLQVELEDVAAASWWAGVLATLSSTSGARYLRFVGRVGGRRPYRSPTFPAPASFGLLPVQEAWAPGMGEALDDLRRELAQDGWVEVACGSQPWELTYRRGGTPVAAAPSSG